MFHVEARPDPLPLEPSSTAVVVVDMQNDFGAEGGMFDRAGIPISGIRSVVAPTARVLAAARAAGMQVVYLTMQFEPDLSDAGGPNAPNLAIHRRLGLGDPVAAPHGREGRILVRDTWNTEILSELAPEEGDIVVPKHRFSGFFETDLDAILKERGITSLVFTGCTTSVCVESTLRDAFFRDYRCLLLEDCCAEPIGGDLVRSNHDASVLTIQMLFGWVSDSSRFDSALSVSSAVPA
ncbi:MAG: cysteine hydrolase [Actinobacteria bacterium]|nr:cysteine hydrolase [Actinomycetota bacterium]